MSLLNDRRKTKRVDIRQDPVSPFFIAPQFNHEIHEGHEKRNENALREFSVLFVPP
jgi:hypothetical protein